MVGLHNYMEEAVLNSLEDLSRTRPDIKELCSNKDTRLDIAAYALNRLPSKYVVTLKGNAYTKLTTLQGQFRTDIIKELVNAVQKVKLNPRK